MSFRKRISWLKTTTAVGRGQSAHGAPIPPVLTVQRKAEKASVGHQNPVRPKVSACHAQIGDPTVADSILDRLVRNAHRLELSGESLRKDWSRKSGGGRLSCNSNAFGPGAVPDSSQPP